MANAGIFNFLTDNYYVGIVTILSYRTVLAEYLSSLKLDVYSKPILVDTALKGGSEFERFLECCVDETGHINYKTATLVNPSDEIKKKADFLLSLNENSVQNSPLTRSQKSRILSKPKTRMAL